MIQLLRLIRAANVKVPFVPTLETWHLDIEEFLELRKNTGDDRRRAHDMNSANWIPDLFMKRVFDDGDWTLFSPNEVPDLHDLYGKAFEERYEHYEQASREEKIMYIKRLRPKIVAQDVVHAVRNRTPWVTFKDRMQCALTTAACGHYPLIQPLHRDHLEHQSG